MYLYLHFTCFLLHVPISSQNLVQCVLLYIHTFLSLVRTWYSSSLPLMYLFPAYVPISWCSVLCTYLVYGIHSHSRATVGVFSCSRYHVIEDPLPNSPLPNARLFVALELVPMLQALCWSTCHYKQETLYQTQALLHWSRYLCSHSYTHTCRLFGVHIFFL